MGAGRREELETRRCSSPAVLRHPRLSSRQLTPSSLTPIISPNLIRLNGGRGGGRGAGRGLGSNRGPSRALVEAAAPGIFLLRGSGRPRTRALAGDAGAPGRSPPAGRPRCRAPVLPGSHLREAELRHRPLSGEIRPESVAPDATGQWSAHFPGRVTREKGVGTGTSHLLVPSP